MKMAWLVAFAAQGLVCGTVHAQAAAGTPLSAPGKTIQLSKVIEDDETTEPVVHLKVGTICLFSSKLTITKQKVTLPYERYENLFAEALKKAGFNVVATSQDLFASDQDKGKADFLVGGTMRPETIDLCSSINGIKGSVGVSMDWQVYDRAAQKVVATLTTRGTGTREKFSRAANLEIYNDAFVASLQQLIANGLMQKIVGLPQPVPSAPVAPISATSAAPTAPVPAPVTTAH